MKTNKFLLGVMVLSAATCAADDVNKNVNVEGLVGKADVKLDLKIRYVDAFQIMQNSKVGIQTGEELMKTNQKWSEEINKRSQDFEKEVAEFKVKRATMSTESQVSTEKRLQKEERELKAYIEERNQDFQRHQAKATETMLAQVREAASEIAKSENIDVIVDKMTGQVLYNSKKADMTDKIVATMDKRFSKSTVTAENKKVSKSTTA